MVRDEIMGYIPSSMIRDWWRQTVLLVTDFETFIEYKVDRPGIRYEVMVMMVIGTLGSIGMFYLSQQVMAASRLDEMAFVSIGRTIRPFFIPLLFWAGYTILFYFVTNHIGGFGHARRLVKSIAWAFAPVALANAVRSVAVWWVYRDFPYQDTFEGFGPAAHYESVLIETIQDPAMLFSTAVLVISLLWSGYLMSYAIQYARSISRKNAVRIVAIPYALHIILVIYYTWTESLSGLLFY